MTKQLLIYDKVETVNAKKHSDLSVKAGDNYDFARKINSVPIMAAEFPNAGLDCAIVFAGTKELLMPVMLMGFRDGENLYIDEKGHWTINYVPAFFRRYPFVFSSADQGKTFTLCIDADFPGCNVEGRGERLFDADGEQTQYTKNVLEFLQDYQVSYQRTEVFAKRLKEMDLLEPMTAQFTSPDGVSGNLTGFMAVDREKVKKLSSEQLEQLAASDELELIYIHIHSLLNFQRMLKKMDKPEQAVVKEKPAEKTAKASTEKASSPVATTKKSAAKKS